MAFLPEDPQKQLKLLIAILAVAAGALYFNFLHRPGSESLIEMSDRVEDLETQNQVAEARVGNLQRLRDDLDLAERQLDALQRLVPQGSEVPEIYEAIASRTQALDLRLINIEPLVPTPADSSGTLMRQEWVIIVEGEYHDIARFLTEVASFDRIVRPRVTELSPLEPGSDRQQLTASFSLETFVLDEGAAPILAPAADAGGVAVDTPPDEGDFESGESGDEGGVPLMGGAE